MKKTIQRLLALVGIDIMPSIARIVAPMARILEDLDAYAKAKTELSKRLDEDAAELLNLATDAQKEAVAAEALVSKYRGLVA